MNSTAICTMISLMETLGGLLGSILVPLKFTAYRLQQLENKITEK